MTARASKWGPTTQKLYRLPDELLARLDEAAERRGVPVTTIVTHALNEELDHPDAWLDRLRLLPNLRKLSLLNAILDTISRELENPE